MRPIFGLAGSEELIENVLQADPSELCDAYDAWQTEYAELRKLVTAVWDRSCVQACARTSPRWERAVVTARSASLSSKHSGINRQTAWSNERCSLLRFARDGFGTRSRLHGYWR
jgi:hypothetical protein